MTVQRRRTRRRALTLGLVFVLAGCTPAGGGCAPVEDSGGTVTTVGADGTTTTYPDDTTTTTEPDDTTTTLPDGEVDTVRVDDLEVEDCFSPVDTDTFVDEVHLIDCTAPHRMEVFAQYRLDEAAEYPGGSELTWAAQDECRTRFDGYVGHSYWDSDFDLTVLTPSFSTWDVGDRTMTCLVVDPSGALLDGPAKGAGR